MKTNRHISIFGMAMAALLLLCVSCIKEPLDGLDSERVGIDISTRSVVGETVDGIFISKVRILVSDNLTGSIVYNEYKTTIDGNLEEITPEDPEDDHLYFRIKLIRGSYTAFAVVNEPEPLDNIASVGALEAVKVTNVHTTPENENPLFCSQKFMLRIDTDNPTYGEVLPENETEWVKTLHLELKRTFVKFSLHAKTTSSASITITKITLTNLPTWNYLVEKSYSSNTLIDTSIVTNNNLPLTSTFARIDSMLFCERRFADELTAPCVLTIEAVSGGQTAEYSCDITDALFQFEQDYPLPLPSLKGNNLVRNNHYKLDVTITDSITFNIRIIPWMNWDATSTDPGTGLVDANSTLVISPIPADFPGLAFGGTFYVGSHSTTDSLANEFYHLDFSTYWNWTGTDYQTRFETLLPNPDDFFTLDFYHISFRTKTLTLQLPVGFVADPSAVITFGEDETKTIGAATVKIIRKPSVDNITALQAALLTASTGAVIFFTGNGTNVDINLFNVSLLANTVTVHFAGNAPNHSVLNKMKPISSTSPWEWDGQKKTATYVKP